MYSKRSERQRVCRPGYYQSVNGLMVTHALGHMMHELPCIHVYYAHLTSVGFKNSICHR